MKKGYSVRGTLLAAGVIAAGSVAGGSAGLAADAIKVGVLTPLSGSYAPIGKQVKNGAELAVKQLNEMGGVTFELVFADSEANPQVAVRRAEQLYQQDGVDFLTGTVNSGATLAVGQVAERVGKLMATTVSYSTAITGAKCSPNVFRVNANAFMQSNALTAWLAKNVSGKRYFFIGPDYEMGKNTIAAFQADVERHGGENVGEVFAPLGAKDLSTYFGQMRAARPEVVMTAMAGNDTVRLLTQMQEYGLLTEGLTLAGASGAVTPENIGAMNGAAEGFVSAAGYAIDLDTPKNKAFVEQYRAAYDSDPDLFAADSYGLFFLLADAIKAAGGVDTDALRKEIEGREWETPQGIKTIRAGDHQAVMPMQVIQVKNEQFMTIDQVDGNTAVGPDTCERF